MIPPALRARLPHARATVRLRLTLMYAALFLVAGVIMIVILYALLSRALTPPEMPPPEEPHIGEVITEGDDVTMTIEEQIDQARREERESALQQVQIQAGIALLASVFVALTFGWVIAGRVLSPIRDITAHAREANAATLDRRLQLDGPEDELKELADTFDAMLDRLQSAFESQRHFAAKASHELRTPIAIIAAEADVIAEAPDASDRERTTARAIRTAADRSERLIDGLLTLSRSDSTMRDDTRIDLADVAGDVIGELVAAADAASIAIDLELHAAFVQGDRVLLERFVGNLVENAIRYNAPSRGWIRVVVSTEDERAQLLVENAGRDTPIGDLDRLFEPFARGAQTGTARQKVTGFGLGLAIVRSVVDAHRGELQATARPDGGLRVIVTFPRTDVP